MVRAAAAAGVQRIVYLSFVGAAPDCTFTFGRDHWYTEQAIRESGLDFTFLRDNQYQDIIPHFADADGVIAGPAGDGKVAAVTRADVADCAGEVDGWVSTYTAIAQGDLAQVSDAVPSLTGHPATDFTDYLATLPKQS